MHVLNITHSACIIFTCMYVFGADRLVLGNQYSSLGKLLFPLSASLCSLSGVKASGASHFHITMSMSVVSSYLGSHVAET